jgi:four helix bundle protein
MKTVEDLDVFKYSDKLAFDIYEITKTFPRDEIFALTNQMRRAAVSICSNLSEGGSRLTSAELKHFIGIARGSVAELRYQISLAQKLWFIDDKNAEVLSEQAGLVHKMLTGLLKYAAK